MLNFQTIRTRPRVFQQLTGLTLAAFETLLADFERAYDDDRQQRDRQRPTPRQRRPGGGAKGALPTPADKLAFLLFYFRRTGLPGRRRQVGVHALRTGSRAY